MPPPLPGSFTSTSVTSITLLIPSQSLGRPLSSLGSLDRRPVFLHSLDPSDQGYPPKRASQPLCCKYCTYNVHTVVMTTDLMIPLPLSPPFFWSLRMCPLVSVVETIRRAVSRHSSAYIFLRVSHPQIPVSFGSAADKMMCPAFF